MAARPEAGEIWDVVVVGAGPAGSSAARAAALAGARTLLVDRSDLPRYKTCGGGLIGVSQQLVPDLGADGLPPRDTIDRVTFTLGGGHPLSRTTSSSGMRMTTREELDVHLVRGATSDGVRLATPTRVSGLSVAGENELLVHTGDGDLRARAVVGADGTAGVTARHVGTRHALVDLGLEVELAAGAQAERWRGHVHLDWGPLPASYGWVFPKGDTLTVGVIADRGRPAETRAYLDRLCRDVGVDGLEVLRSSGHLTRCRTADSPLSRGRVLLAGDAAGLLEPWTREGISFALRSGAMAGRRAVEMARAVGPRSMREVELAGRGFRSEVETTLGAEMRAGAACRAAFARHPATFHRLLGGTTIGWRAFDRLVAGETDLGRAWRHRLVRLAVGALARL